MQTWITVWTLTWVVGMVVFTLLSIAITIFGAKDLLYLLRNLKSQHQAQEQVPPAETP